NQALPLERAVGDKSGEALTLNNLGVVYADLGEKRKALEFYNQALPLRREIGDKSGEANTLNNLGNVYSDLGEKQKALEFYNQALPLKRAVGDKSGEANTLGNFMLLWSKLGKRALAIFYGKQAINDYQQLRSNIQGLDKETQKTYLQTVETRYRQLADLLISEGRLPEAQQVLGLLKEEEYFEFVRRDGNEASGGHSQRTLEDASLEKRYHEIADRLTALAAEYGQLRDKATRTTE